MFDKYKNLNYYIYFPQNFNKTEKIAILFDLHGAGRRGRDVSVLTSAALEKELENGLELPCIVIAPQCYADTWFDIFEQLQEFVIVMVKKYGATAENTFLSGTSMGGYAAWQLLMSMPDTFSRAVICCGGGMYWNAGRIKAEVKAYHGELDRIVYPEESKKMCDAINANGGKAELTLFKDLEHNCWDRVFYDENILAWLTNK